MKICKTFLVILAVVLFCTSCKKQDNSSEKNRQQTKELRRVKWRLASSFTEKMDLIYGSAKQFCDRVAELTNNKFIIMPYQRTEIAGGDVFYSVQQGATEMGQSAGYYHKAKDERLIFDTCIPFGLSPRQQNAWFYEGGGLELIRKVYDKFNIMYFPGGNTGHQMGGWFQKQINSLEDIKGLRFRIPGMGGDVFSRMGASVSTINPGEIYTSLERGAIDATEWIGPHDDFNSGLYKIAKNYYYPNWWEIGATVAFYVNKDSWESLPRSYQAAIEVAANETNVKMLAKYDHYNSVALQKLKKEGVNLNSFNPAIIAEAQKETLAFLKEIAAEDQEFAEVFNSWEKYLNQQQAWFDLRYKN